MIRKLIVALALCCTINSSAWAQIINFNKESWQKVIALGQKQKKIIFVDLFAVWNSDNSKMEQLALQHNDVRNYFEEHFVNYRANGEEGDGKAIVDKYKVIGYPTQLFIDAKTQEIIAKFEGYADASTLLDRAKIAVEAQKDTKTWKTYNAEYTKNKKDKEFLTAYIAKGSLIDENIDEALNDYMEYVKPELTEETVHFLTKHIKTLNNKAVEFIVSAYQVAPEGIAMLDNWLPSLYDNTYDLAVSKKNTQILKKILWASEKTNNPNATSIYNRFLGAYYLKLKEYNNYWKIAEEQLHAYQNKSITQYRQDDSLAYDELVQSYKTQLTQYGVAEKDHLSYIEETLKGKIEAQYQISYMAASNIHEILNNVLEHGSTNKDLLQKANKWGQFMMDLIDPLTFEWSYFGLTFAELNVLMKNNAKAKEILELGIVKAKGNNTVIKLLKEELGKIQ